jgi:hypothetical protein
MFWQLFTSTLQRLKSQQPAEVRQGKSLVMLSERLTVSKPQSII